MDRDLDALLGFAPDYDAPIPYMQRTRDYYAAIGYTTPYRWAHYVEAPFTPLRKPLAAVARDHRHHRRAVPAGQGRPGTRRALQRRREVLPGLFGRHVAAARPAHLAHRLRPQAHHGRGQRHLVPAAGAAARRGAAGRIGAVAPRFHGAPTNRSHRVTVETDAPEILRRCREDGADAAILVPNCPVCHQTCSLVARHLEANGIPTVVMGCAKDIVEHAARAALPVQRLPARQQRRQAARRGLAGPHAGAGAARAGGRARAAHHDAVAAALERGCVVEARLPEPGPHRARGTGPPPRASSTSRRRSRANCAWRRRRDARPRPFADVRVLDFTQVLAGPYGSYQLALLGADVIKVERREGEDMRRTPLSREWADRGMAPAWLAINGNKRSLTLDLQKPAAIEIVNRLAAKADVVMENFRPGVMDRLGIGYEALSRDQPAADLLHDLRLRQHRPVSQRGRLRRQDPGAVRHHVADRPQGDGPDPRRLRGVRRAVRHDRRLRRVIGAVSAHAYRRRASSSTCRCWRRASPSSPPRSPTSRSPATGRSSSATRRSAARSPPTCSAPRTAICCSR